MRFTEEQLEQIEACYEQLDEIYVETRKGVPQTVYVIEVPEESVFYSNYENTLKAVDGELIGYWKQEFPSDNSYETCYCVVANNRGWVKCEKKEKIITTWEEIE